MRILRTAGARGQRGLTFQRLNVPTHSGSTVMTGLSSSACHVECKFSMSYTNTCEVEA